jgi:membrane protein YdbS with pleckstrin-like domain
VNKNTPDHHAAYAAGATAPAALYAEFNPLLKPYLVLYVAGTLVSTIIGIPFAILWVLGLGQWWARHYFDKLECELSDKTLRYRKGIIFQVEKTIPLENIQDVTFIEGPLLRRFHLSILKFETAGQSAGQAHDMHLAGIIDAHEFRNEIIARRERLKRVLAQGGGAQAGTNDQTEILKGIQKSLDEIVTLLKQKP